LLRREGFAETRCPVATAVAGIPAAAATAAAPRPAAPAASTHTPAPAEAAATAAGFLHFRARVLAHILVEPPRSREIGPAVRVNPDLGPHDWRVGRLFGFVVRAGGSRESGDERDGSRDDSHPQRVLHDVLTHSTDPRGASSRSR